MLNLFYSNPNRSFYVREITRKIDEQINSVRRELANLLNIGIIKSETNNNRLYYEVDQDYEYYKPLVEIFGGKSGDSSIAQVELAEKDDEILKALGNVELILLTGNFTRDNRSEIDLLLVGDLNPTQTAKYVKELEQKEDREVRYATMPGEEFRYRQEVNDRFLSLVLASKHQIIVDNRPKKTTKKSKKEE